MSCEEQPHDVLSYTLRLDCHLWLQILDWLEVIWRQGYCQIPGHALQLPFILLPSLHTQTLDNQYIFTALHT